MIQEQLRSIAEQVLEGKKLHEIDFGEPRLDLEEKLRRIDLALKLYPAADVQGPDGADSGLPGR